MTDLKPCPFCGCKDILCEEFPRNTITIKCRGCRAQFVGQSKNYPILFTEEKLKESWNNRPSPWRPIEEASRNGTRLLLRNDRGNIEIGFWSTSTADKYQEYPCDGYWQFDEHGDCCDSYAIRGEVTHFMLIPEFDDE